MSPEAECLGCRKIIYAPTLEELQQKELEHHRASLNSGTGLHKCRVFSVEDDEGNLLDVHEFAHGKFVPGHWTR